MSEAGRKVLCRLVDIPDGDSKGFEIGEGPTAFEFFITREEFDPTNCNHL